ncbi:unnamed protein product [Ceratitis capitata]|uniref:(Mediterranean fruit fly) hypothetical protein n=1 Tax=Ceratitis capitata TaxID=7213 RepID=A0A811UXP4_CERCA|nr:unnamed protein product [Ceratitis capitata]
MTKPHLFVGCQVWNLFRISMFICLTQTCQRVNRWALVDAVKEVTNQKVENKFHFRKSSAAPKSDEMANTCKDLLTNLHDRVSVLASLDEDLRKRLESIENK